jgi:GT2 family glycosyltransferase
VRDRLRQAFGQLATDLSLARQGGFANALFFDDGAYQAKYGDVARAVEAGRFRNGFHHFVRWGRWEGRPFPLRDWGLGTTVAQKVHQGAQRVEQQLGALGSSLTLGELGHRLLPARTESSEQAVAGAPAAAGRGPWRAQLPRWAQRRGWYMLEIAVDARDGGAVFVLQMLDGLGSTLGSACALHCRPHRVTKRLLRFEPGARQVQVAAQNERSGARPKSVRIKPLPQGFAESRILRRLAYHHPWYLGASEQQMRAKLQRVAEQAGRPVVELMWDAYETTFAPPQAWPEYRQWIQRVEDPENALLDREAPACIQRLERHPLISVLLPTYETEEAMLRACLDSVLAQSYPHWELCVVDDASQAPHVSRLLRQYAEREPRIRVRFREVNGHICAASNDALGLARGEYVALLDHDDLLPRHALLHVAEAIQAHPDAVLLYGDEDKIGPDGTRRDPHFKPDWDPDLLLGQNYVAHLMVLRTHRARSVGGFRSGYEGAQDHDLALRVCEGVGRHQVRHIPRILYHWRQSAESTAGAAGAKPYTSRAGVAAVGDYLRHTGAGATAEAAELPNCYRARWPLPEPPPRVSLIVPTRDAVDFLRTCVQTTLEKTEYPNYEILIVDNDSSRAETHAYFNQIQSESGVRLLRYPGPFNYSAINNLAAREASGSVLALLNNDIEVIDGGWLREMVSLAVRPEIGCVGAKLLYPNGTIQHAGVVLGLHGLAGHAFRHLPGENNGYFARLRLVRSVSAVTAACMVVRREVWLRVGGMDEQQLAVAFNDVDLCLKVREAGYRNLFTPHAVFVHHESATRGADEDPTRRDRFVHEQQVMRERWGRKLFEDPYFSPHLSLDHDDFVARVPPRVLGPEAFRGSTFSSAAEPGSR